MNVLRVILRLLLTLVVLVVVILAALYARGLQVADGKVQRRVPAFAAATDSASLARGRHLAEISCTGCHSQNEQFPLAGPDSAIVDDPMMATIHPPNLTPGGVLKNASDGQIARAIREGVSFDDRRMFIMPSPGFHGMSDADLAAVIGFLRSQPAVAHQTKPRKMGPIGAMLIASGQFPSKLPTPVDQPVIAPAEAATAEYGAYLTPIFACKECHGQDLHGVKPGPGPPPGPDIVRVAHAVPYETFENAVRHGVASSGRVLSREMPWSVFARLTDTEMQAVYAYVKSLP